LTKIGYHGRKIVMAILVEDEEAMENHQNPVVRIQKGRYLEN